MLDKLNLLPYGNKVWRGEKTDFEGCLKSFMADGMTWHYCSLRRTVIKSNDIEMMRMTLLLKIKSPLFFLIPVSLSYGCSICFGKSKDWILMIFSLIRLKKNKEKVQQ